MNLQRPRSKAMQRTDRCPLGRRGGIHCSIPATALALIAMASLACSPPAGHSPRERPNVLLIAVDDLRPELASFGVDYIHSPHIDRLAQSGRIFLSHYVQAPTCGASRFALLTGRYGGVGNAALFDRARQLRTDPDSVPPSMPAWFRSHGYTTVSVGKVSHHPGGFGGPDWNDLSQLEMPGSWDRHLLPAGPWQHPRGWMHGLAHGEIRIDRGDMDVFQAAEGDDSIYPDGGSVEEALRQIDLLASEPEKPFFLAVGILRPHLPFGAPKRYLEHYLEAELPPTPHPGKPADRTTWHASGEFMGYNRWNRDPNEDAEFAEDVRRHYAACVSYADAQVGKLLDRISSAGVSTKTIVILWGDHGWHLGEHGVWGKHTLFEESLRSPLVVSVPGMAAPGEATEAIVETLDVFPSLCDLAGIPVPYFVHGVSLRPQLDDPASPGHPSIAYHRQGSTIRTRTHRLVLHEDGFAELYDHTSEHGETTNIAQSNAELVAHLSEMLGKRLDLARQNPAASTE